MNFNELFQKMRELDQPVVEEDEMDPDGKIQAELEKFLATNPEDGDDLRAFHHKAISDKNKELDDYLSFLYDYVADQTGAGGTEEDGVYDEMLDMLSQMIADKGWSEEIKINGKSTGDIKREEVVADGCGMPGMSNMPSSMMGMPKQQDSVNMNVSLNAAGSNGIKDLMDILKNIDNKDQEMEMPIAIGIHDTIEQEEYANEPDEVYGGIDAVTGSGNDLHKSKDMYKHSYQQGDNPMAMESLKNRLGSLYQEIKNR